MEKTITKLKQLHISTVDYHITYSISSLILLFFSFSALGWIWEVALHVIEDHAFINRGVMNGPWLPIYGTGGVLILVVLKRWIDHPFKLCALIMGICGVLEYTTSLILETLFQAKWWGYSEYFFNLHGRIFLGGLIFFGIGGCIFIYLIAPWIERCIQTIAKPMRYTLCVCLITIFLADTFCSFMNPNMGFGITI